MRDTMSANGLFFLAVVLGAAAAGCEDDPAERAGGQGGDADADADADGDTDSDADADGDGDTDGDACDEQNFAIEMEPVKLMILQDMSMSMNEETPTKWSEAQKALVTLLEDPLYGNIWFGFDGFPDDGNCGVDNPVLVDTSAGTAASIAARIRNIASMSGSAATPLCTALRKFDTSLFPTYAPGFTADDAARYLLLVSDGGDPCWNTKAKCGSNALVGGRAPSIAEYEAKIAALLAQGIRTFAVGFGSGVNPAELNAIAAAGDTQFDYYMVASNEQELEDAFDAIAGSVISCSYDLKDPNATANPDKVNFYFDGAVVPYDADCAEGKGWMWNDAAHKSITFCFESCGKLRTGTVANIAAKFGCKTVTVVK